VLRAARWTELLFGALFGAIVPVCAAPAGLLDLSGVVHDTLGNFVQDAEILVADPGVSGPPVATARSGADGRFRLNLAPGSYVVAALKNGYRTFVGRVDTSTLHGWLEVVLGPALAAEPAQPGPSPGSWALRLPRRGILREVEAEPAGPEPSPGAASKEPEPVRLELAQIFSTSPRLAGGDAAGGELDATGTRMAVASPLGERVSLLVEGKRERFDAAGARDPRARARQDQASMSVGLS
jgi:hypothetical protein